MNKVIAIGFILLFSLQVGVKSMVALYFRTFAEKDARENCEYKTITICKGSCYIAKQIKIVSSANHDKSESTPDFDLQSFKDALCIYPPSVKAVEKNLNYYVLNYGSKMDLYNYFPTYSLLKPPAA